MRYSQYCNTLFLVFFLHLAKTHSESLTEIIKHRDHYQDVKTSGENTKLLPLP